MVFPRWKIKWFSGWEKLLERPSCQGLRDLCANSRRRYEKVLQESRLALWENRLGLQEEFLPCAKRESS